MSGGSTLMPIVDFLNGSILNIIIKNNFIDNERDAYFAGGIFRFNIWLLNYWYKPRILPKLIFGKIKKIGLVYITIPWINFDWHPARKPYDIEGVK